MDISLLILLLVIALGTYIQTATGFGFGLIVLGIGGALELMTIPELAFVVSILSLVNGISGLYGGVWRQAQFRSMWVFLSAAIPMAAFGLYWLDHLGQAALNALQGLLGIVMILACVSSMLKPDPLKTPSPSWHFALSGVFAGLLSGLFSTAGPPISYLMYRQPVPLAVIRSTLLSLFLLLASFRASVSVFTVSISTEVQFASLIGTPLVLVGTYFSRRFLLSLLEADVVKRLAMGMLVLSGGILLVKAVF